MYTQPTFNWALNDARLGELRRQVTVRNPRVRTVVKRRSHR